MRFSSFVGMLKIDVHLCLSNVSRLFRVLVYTNNSLIIRLGRDHNYGNYAVSGPKFYETRMCVGIGYSH